MGAQTDFFTLGLCADRLVEDWNGRDSRDAERLAETERALLRLGNLTPAEDEYRQVLVAVVESLRQPSDIESLEVCHRLLVHVRDRCRTGHACH